VVADDAVLTYRELDNRANQVARYLRDQGIASGDRVGLLFDKTIETYIALLAVMKLITVFGSQYWLPDPSDAVGIALGWMALGYALWSENVRSGR